MSATAVPEKQKPDNNLNPSEGRLPLRINGMKASTFNQARLRLGR